MAIDVTVTEQCDRCKRKEQVTIPSDRIGEFERRQIEAQEHQAKVTQFVQDNEGALPDLVVIFKGKVQMLSNVCDAYCAKTVQNNVDVLFREVKPRKPRKKKDKTEAKSEGNGKTEEAKADDKATKRKGKSKAAASAPAG
jgi:hypothetical protein